MSSERLCLGRIKSIEPYHLNISLIYGARGRVQIADVSSPYREALEQLLSGDANINVKKLDQMFTVGQVVRCCLKEGEKAPENFDRLRNSALELSLNPSRVNQNIRKGQIESFITLVGAVSSIEDNGYIIDAGIHGLSVFLPFDKTSLRAPGRFSIGSLVEFSIVKDQSSGINARVARATMLKKQKIHDDSPLPFDCFLPGMRIPLRIRSKGPEGLQCDFQSFSVYVPAQHCPLEVNHYTIDSRVIACIVSVDHFAKAVIASLLPHFVKEDLDDSRDLLAFKHVKIGSMHDDAVLKRRERNCKANAFDVAPSKRWTSQIPENTPMKCRVVDFDLFLNMPVISCRKRVLESKFLSLNDVNVGATVTVTVRKLLKRGISVRLAGRIRGIIPFMHLSDAPIKNPQDRFKVGSKIISFVLGVDLEKEELLLTARKSLMSSSLPILGSSKMVQAWEEAEHSDKTGAKHLLVTAFVVHLSKRGVLVCGMNNVRGWIPRRQTFVEDTQSVETFFNKGETLQLRVIKRLKHDPQRSDKPSTQFLLSQILDPTKVQRPAPQVSTSVSLGEIYYCRVNRVQSSGLRVGLCTTSGTDATIIAEATLPFPHLSDSISIAQLAQQSRLDCFQPKTMLSINADGATSSPTRVVVVGVTTTEVIVSAKPSLVTAAAGHEMGTKSCGFVRSFEQLVVGSQWVGWIAHHKDYGVFVEFPGGLRGLVPTRYISDRRASHDIVWPLLLPPGASVEAKVVEVSASQQRFLLSLRMMDTYSSAAEQYVEGAIARTHRYLDECRWICSHVKHLSQLSQFALGEVVHLQVDGVTEEAVTGTVATAANSGGGRVPAVALLLNTEEVECVAGGVYPAVVTLPNLEAGCLEVALLPWLLRGVRQRAGGQFAADAMQVRLGQSIDSSVVSLGNGRDVVVVALKQHALGHLAVVPTRRFFNDLIGGNAWALAQANRVTVRSEVESHKVNTSNKAFFATLSIYDPLRENPRTRAVGGAATEIETVSPLPASLEQLTTPGTRLPEVVFIGLKGRAALFRLPHTRGLREIRSRLICRLVDLVPTGKAARKFLHSPPPCGTVFHNAIVVSAPSTTALEGKGGARLPLSCRVARISFVEKDPELGDLVCAMFLGVSNISWRLLLSNNARGLLHVSCMSKSHTTEASSPLATPPLQFPRHPKNGVWLTCRIIDVAHGQTTVAEAADESRDDEAEVKAKGKIGPQIAEGDEIVPVGDDEDAPSKAPPKFFYVSTETSDLRKWNPEKYQDLDLALDIPMFGFIKRRFKKFLVVSLNYKTDAVVPYSAAFPKSNQRVGSVVQIILTSLKPLRGCLANEPVRRRSASTSDAVAKSDGPSGPKRRRLVSFSARTGASVAPTIGDIRDRYADFLSPLFTEQEQQPLQNEDKDMEVENPCQKAVVAASSSLLTSLRNESRLAEVAQATMLGSETAHPLPRISSVEEYEVAVRNSPQNAHLWTLYAVHHQAAGDVERARTVLQRALDSPAASADNAGGFTGTILLSSLRLESSVATAACVGVERSVGSTPTAPLLDAVIAHIEQLDREAVTRRAVSVLSTAGLHSYAENMAKKFVRQHSALPEAWQTLVRARFRAGNVTGAREAQRNAGQTLRLSQLLQFAVGCARLEFEFGDVDRAIKLVEEQLVAHPQKKVVYVNYIQLLMSAGKSAEAELVRENALRKLPEKDHASIKKLFSNS
ncbi:NADP dependent isocitrate dehydrogenase [Echinococcus multilocularis]|uniref:NADP dependent isocitrate dehydrogenase n=1 Tax=Echinococcus multilocularis TaxID=6211 RepID=A0A068YLG2_ECHMU|nr:NADP dependent isocitrate dehydrogenase [Echinococcus multilocularis]